jgi:hypothetical protein
MTKTLFTIVETLLLLIGFGAIAYGVRLWSVAAGYVVGGLLTILLAVLMNRETSGPTS